MINKVLAWVITNLSNLSLLAIGLMIIGGTLRIPALFMVGAGFFLALLTVLLLKLVYSFLYRVIPQFSGKIIVILILFIIVGVFIVYLASLF